MRTISYQVALVILALGTFSPAQAWFDPAKSNNKGSQERGKMANCAPATARTQLELNNVRALIETGGSMWQDRATGTASYEIPKGSGHTALYSGALWMGGKDVNGQLKIAATMFRQGNDFWAGPLTIDAATVDTANGIAGYGAAEITDSECEAWDRTFTVTRAEVEEFVAQFACGYCDPNYTVPNSIKDWPAHSNEPGKDFYLAPFFDFNNDGLYNPVADGDYPYYDLDGDIDCQSCDGNREVYLKGDQTIWWVMNDKGNIHTETGGDPIGMEIRAQAFAFTTNDEINNMTFYNYEMINRGTQTLFDTYFAQWVDPDLGGPNDDYIGCDVQRGLGYAYNGDAFDADDQGAIGYGANPPAIGVDFFEGPYVDNDGVDNLIYDNVQDALDNNGIVYPGIGLGYGDECDDNERFGMRRFVYFNREATNPNIVDPSLSQDFYNYMTGYWLDGSQMIYGGDGHDPNGGTPSTYMFPGDSDPLNWATNGVAQGGASWTEQNEGVEPGDRRFVQAAGPFTLKPGAVNNITVGVVYARGSTGDPFESVRRLRLADDKAQLLFENCFRVVEGPDAPELTIQELNQELIVTISNPGGNNMGETAISIDPNIPETLESYVVNYVEDPNNPGSFLDSSFTQIDTLDRFFRFQGYQVFQLKDETVGPEELLNPDRARPVFQCDIKDSVGQLLNYELDQNIGATNAIEMVNGADEGISHSFKVTEDLFAQGDRRLVNHKKYHFMAIAYSVNNYKPYNPDDPNQLDGQKKPYLASRRSWDKGEIKTFTGIPHIPSPELGGTVQHANYGDQPFITRIEGQGNGGLVLDLTAESEEALFQAPYAIDHPVYQRGNGPITVKVIDPLNVTPDDFILRYVPGADAGALKEATWELENLTTQETIFSDRTIEVGNEQLLPDYGISITIEQSAYEDVESVFNRAQILDATLEFADSSKQWLTGVPDGEGEIDQNWIRSGTVESYSSQTPSGSSHPDITTTTPGVYKDGDQAYEAILGGTWAPYALTAIEGWAPTPNGTDQTVQGEPAYDAQSQSFVDIEGLASVDIVITNDRSKWTRCVVVEMQDNPDLAKGGVNKFDLRADASLDNNLEPTSGTGMGWFPGYAVNLETGERLNMAFGENSWLTGENGGDMQWNPSGRMYTNTGETLFGGMHYVYVFHNERQESGDVLLQPSYDQGQFCYDMLSSGSPGNARKVWRSAMWVGVPLVADGEEFGSSDVRVRLRVNKPYETYAVNGENNAYPQYTFSLKNMATEVTDLVAAEDALSLVNVVPNPYYAYSAYETSRLDNRIKITNLPDRCNVRIYTVNGTLVRTLTKDSPVTSVDWDLKNQAGVPIAGGVYLIHVEAPGVGEVVLKWFGALRPIDLENF